jgi:hypothetical protein
MKRKLSYSLRSAAGYQEVGAAPQSIHINDAEEALGLVLLVIERDDPFDESARFYAKFDGLEVVDGGLRAGCSGNGRTPKDAIAAYLPLVSGKPCVTGGYSNPRRFTMPKLHI